MRTGVSYMGHHNPQHIATDLREMQTLRLDDVLLAAQENDFAHFPGKLRYTSEIARDLGLRPIAIFWGALNVFGGGCSSQFLLEHPQGRQVGLDGSPRSEGCYVNAACVGRIERMIDTIAELRFAGYFVDEPTPLRDCFCPACRARYGDWNGGDLAAAPADEQERFRQRCVVEYVTTISTYCKMYHPELETMACLMPTDSAMWEQTAEIAGLDNLGTDIYWVNDANDVEEMAPLVRQIAGLCAKHGKKHHEWLQCWRVRGGKEPRIVAQGDILVRERPDALYVWAWKGQVGTTESCDDPEKAWRCACEVLAKAKEAG